MSDAVEPLDLDEVLAEMRECARVERHTSTVQVPVAHLALVTAEVERLRAALTTARRDALTEAADAFWNARPNGTAYNGYTVANLLRARAAQEEDR